MNNSTAPSTKKVNVTGRQILDSDNDDSVLDRRLTQEDFHLGIIGAEEMPPSSSSDYVVVVDTRVSSVFFFRRYRTPELSE